MVDASIMKKQIKKQRCIHAIAAVLQVMAVLVASYYLPPYLRQNPGIQILIGTLVVSEVAHAIWHGQ